MSNSNKIKDFLNKNKKYIFPIISLISIVLIIYIVISNNMKFTSKNDEEIILKDGSIVFYHEIKTNKYKFCYKDDLDNENKCEFISKNGMGEAMYKNYTYKPTAKNMNYYYILYSNGDSYVSKSPKFLKSLREEKGFSYGSPFDEIKTSTGKISHKKIKYANDIHEYSANSLSYASRPNNPKEISNLESILYGLN